MNKKLYSKSPNRKTSRPTKSHFNSDHYPEFHQNKPRFTLTPRLLALFLGLFFILVLLISLIGIILRGPGEITITNQSDPNSALLSAPDLSRVKKELYQTLKTVNDIDANYIDTFVRWDTVEKNADGRTTFILDVDNYRQTYLVNLDQYNVTLSCPALSLSKYPDSFCVGNDGEYNDSISVVFGDQLPLTYQTSQGETFEIVRGEITGGEWNRDLAVWIFACPASDQLTSRVSAAVDELISARGASPSTFTKKFYYMPCNAE